MVVKVCCVSSCFYESCPWEPIGAHISAELSTENLTPTRVTLWSCMYSIPTALQLIYMITLSCENSHFLELYCEACNNL